MRRTYESRLKMILAYEFSGSTDYASCDIPTRERIDVLVKKTIKLFSPVYDMPGVVEDQIRQYKAVKK